MHPAHRFLPVTIALLSVSVSALLSFPADYDVIDLDAQPIFDATAMRLSLTSERHQLNVDLEERNIDDAPAFFINQRGEMEPLRLEDSGTTSQLLKGKATKANFILTKDSDGSSQLYGVAAHTDGHIVVHPAPAHVRQTRDIGNWHVIYRRDAMLPTVISDSVYPKDDAFIQKWNATMSKPLGPKTRTGVVEKWVEVITVTDYELYERFSLWMGSTLPAKVVEFTKLYVALLMGDVDDRFRSTFKNDPDLRINIRHVASIVTTEPGKCPWVEGPDVQVPVVTSSTFGRKTFDAGKGLNAFSNWLNALNSPVTFDIGMHLSGRDMRTDGGVDGAAGLGYVTGVCSTWRYATSEVFGSWEESHYVAHEIGHVLGSDHDAYTGNPEAAKCPGEDNYIMTSLWPNVNLLNHALFSSCSKVQMKKTLAMPEKSCVNNNASNDPYTADRLRKYYAGRMYTYMELCKNRHGPNAAPLNYEQLAAKNANICTGLRCYTATPDWATWEIEPIIAPKGTPCGDGKWCMEGVCVADSGAPPGECFLGDTVYDTYDYTVSRWKILQCPDAVTYLTQTKKYATVADICKADAKFKKNCCRMCGVPGGTDTIVRDSIMYDAGTTTSAPTMTTTTTKPPPPTTTTQPPTTTTAKPPPPTTTTTTTTTTTQPPPTPAVPCQAGQTCKYQLPASRCNQDFTIPLIGTVSVSCKATCP